MLKKEMAKKVNEILGYGKIDNEDLLKDSVSRVTLEMFYNKYHFAKQELQGFLKGHEVFFLINVFNGYLFTSQLHATQVLCAEIEDADVCIEVDKKALIEKASKLTEFSAMTLILMCLEFWNTPNIDNETTTKKIERIFGCNFKEEVSEMEEC